MRRLGFMTCARNKAGAPNGRTEMESSGAPQSPLAARFRRDRSGNVATMFGLLILPMLGAVGLAIDFGNIMTARTKAQMAADAAALQASGVARDLMKGTGSDPMTTSAALTEGKKRGEALFMAHATASGLEDATVSIAMERNGQHLTTTTSFSVKTSTYFGSLFNTSEFNASGEAVSSSSLPIFSDVYLALDVSASMGIAGSRADMVKLWNAPAKLANGMSEKTQCVFACHVAEKGNDNKTQRSDSNSVIAKKAGVVLRIDVLRDAVKAMLAEAQKDAESQPIYRFALYTLGGSLDASTWVLNKLATMTDNFTVLNVAAGTIDIQSATISPQYQRSYINEQLASLATELKTSGDGSDQDHSKKYLFLITDGARDVPPKFGSCSTPSGSGRCTNGIDATYCQRIKDKGITVGVLYTTYIPVTNDPADPKSSLEKWYNLEMVQNKFAGVSVSERLSPALKTCASDGWFFEASDAAGIQVAMKKMFEQTTFAPSLTN